MDPRTNLQAFVVLRLNCSRSIKGALMIALRSNPQNRWSSVAAFLGALQETPSRSTEQEIDNFELLQKITAPPSFVDVEFAQSHQSTLAMKTIFEEDSEYRTDIYDIIDDEIRRLTGRPNSYIYFSKRYEEGIFMTNADKLTVQFIFYYLLAIPIVCNFYRGGNSSGRVFIKTWHYNSLQISVKFMSPARASVLYHIFNEESDFIDHEAPLKQTYPIIQSILHGCRGTINVNDAENNLVEIKLTVPAKKLVQQRRF